MLLSDSCIHSFIFSAYSGGNTGRLNNKHSSGSDKGTGDENDGGWHNGSSNHPPAEGKHDSSPRATQQYLGAKQEEMDGGYDPNAAHNNAINSIDRGGGDAKQAEMPGECGGVLSSVLCFVSIGMVSLVLDNILMYLVRCCALLASFCSCISDFASDSSLLIFAWP